MEYLNSCMFHSTRPIPLYFQSLYRRNRLTLEGLEIYAFCSPDAYEIPLLLNKLHLYGHNQLLLLGSFVAIIWKNHIIQSLCIWICHLSMWSPLSSHFSFLYNGSSKLRINSFINSLAGVSCSRFFHIARCDNAVVQTINESSFTRYIIISIGTLAFKKPWIRRDTLYTSFHLIYLLCKVKKHHPEVEPYQLVTMQNGLLSIVKSAAAKSKQKLFFPKKSSECTSCGYWTR